MGKNLIAGGILVVLAVVALIVFREKPSVEKQKVMAAVDPVPEGRLDTIRISRTEGDGDKAVKENIVLKKKDGKWRMAEPVDYAVDERSLEQMTKTLAGLRPADIISEKASSHEKFEVDDKKGIDVTALQGEDELAHIIIGKARDSMTFVRLPGKDPVYRFKDAFRYQFDKSAKVLREKTVIDIKQENIQKVTFKHDGKELVLEQASAESEGEEAKKKIQPVGVEIKNFDEKKAKGVFRALAKITARDFVDEKLPDETTGLGPSATQVVVESMQDDKPVTTTIFVGKDTGEDNQTYVKTSASEQVFLVGDFTTKRFRATADDFTRTDEEIAKEEESRKKAAEAAAKRGAVNPGGMPPGLAAPLFAAASAAFLRLSSSLAISSSVRAKSSADTRKRLVV
jgi:hypothetical protein